MNHLTVRPSARYSRQKGMTLIVSMIMLFLITLATIASFQMSRTNLDIVGNTQFRKEAVDAANSAIQEAMSSDRILTAPNTVFLNPCSAGSNTRCYDFNNDGTDDITVSLTPAPRCVQAQPLSNLAAMAAGNLTCLVGTSAGALGIEGAASSNSLCSQATWQITAVATDNVTDACVVVVQGASVQTTTTSVATACPTGVAPPALPTC